MHIKSKLVIILLSFILAIALITGCSSKSSETVELTISAAASLTDALEEIQTAYENKHENIELNFNFGASGALQQQIELGAPTDVFLSASAANMKTLVDKKFIDASQQTSLLSNELVVIIPATLAGAGVGSIQRIEDLAKENIEHIALGIPETVPAGSYAKEALTNARLWESLQSKIVQTKDVRQVLAYVESGNAEAGFVYKTDALASKKVSIAFNADPNTYTPIVYPAGIVKATKHLEEAFDFYNYLQSDEAKDVFTKYGFTIPV